MTSPAKAPPSANFGASHEAQEAAFSDDPRIHFSKETKRWAFEDDNGNEFEYDESKAAWVSVIDEELLKKQQAAYSVAGVDEEAPAAPVLARQNKKRKEPENYTSATPMEAGPSMKKKKQPERKSKNTSVYVTGLPLDTDHDELVARFSKCGVLEEDDEGEPKVKMYARDDGSFSGDALIAYFKEESVALAVAMLDYAELRIGDLDTRMNVSQAEFSHKETNGAPGAEGEPKPRKVVDKKKATKRIGRMQKKLEEWDDEDNFGPSPDPLDSTTAPNKSGRVVVLKHMFTLDELKKDATLLLDLKEDVREECSEIGDVTNVVLYDLEPEGVMTVKFRDPIAARACILKMHGRFFDGRKVEASLYSGKQRFNRSGAADEFEEDDDASEKKRLDEFAQWLMNEGD